MLKIIKPFYYAKGRKWYFPGDFVEGDAATEAAKFGCVSQTKMMQGPPENKVDYTEIDPEEPDDD